MNGKQDITSQSDSGTTRREELAPCANRFTTDLLLQHAGRAKTILSNLKDLLILRAPKFAHSTASKRTLTIKDENFSRSQIASFALHGSIALFLFLSVVARPPFLKKIPPTDIKTYAPPSDYLRKILFARESGGNTGRGGGGERNPIPASGGQLPPAAQQQIAAPSAHIFPNSILLVTPTVEGAPDLRVPRTDEGWGDPTAKFLTDSNGLGCCQGMGDGDGTGIGPKRGPGAGSSDHDGAGGSTVGPLGIGVRAPTCLYCPKPEYSDEARKVHFQGLVELSVVVLADGKPGRIQLITGPGMGLDEKAIEAVRNWRFRPAIAANGKAVAVTIPIEVQFQLF
jgi:periplasmic protein TonB